MVVVLSFIDDIVICRSMEEARAYLIVQGVLRRAAVRMLLGLDADLSRVGATCTPVVRLANRLVVDYRQLQ